VKTPTRAVGYLLAIHLQDCLCISLVGENTNKGGGNLLAIHLQDCLCISLVGENTNKGGGNTLFLTPSWCH
jgi:hypothetical protein